MLLYLVRHGAAEDVSLTGRDADRRLTAAGRATTEASAARFAQLEPGIDRVVTSPYPRAAETAGILVDALERRAGERPVFAIDDRCAAGSLTVRKAADIAHEGGRRLVLVGHEPDLSQLVLDLTGAAVVMKKGAFACIETISPGNRAGVLRWLVPPAVLLAGAEPAIPET